MNKAESSTLASIFKADIDAFMKQRDAQLQLGVANIRAPAGSEAFNSAYEAVKRLEGRIAHVKLLAQACAMRLNVDRKTFLNECGIFSL